MDGPLCDFPNCSMLSDYRQQKEGMTIAGNGASELGKLMREQPGATRMKAPNAPNSADRFASAEMKG